MQSSGEGCQGGITSQQLTQVRHTHLTLLQRCACTALVSEASLVRHPVLTQRLWVWYLPGLRLGMIPSEERGTWAGGDGGVAAGSFIKSCCKVVLSAQRWLLKV